MAELAKLRVVDLKARLTELGLPVNGVKKDLVEVGGPPRVGNEASLPT